ncbi:DHA2 family efflux MFS transporter permease subunit [Conexibacter woesei]|uniref:Drug resistance transporter, EmrB/QacA subfamily n=1 Tax=Conexibacter woesei (strain DSM 14684 / CCUG 47730 / CIP 108061 / JCM 11494 / NBRC 100937 / ID131577) TaxID=469383 RepID=D3FDS0_CONWI|nr:DHA2 family efflux MFS transporter permease subunit [Conexibacter woesei]ADB49644.1 drug resistance transporter, EmrB/QacA subfamily [Conexibacter woesei DSM 14684]
MSQPTTLTSQSGPASADRPGRERWIALTVLSAAFLMIVLDTTIVSVAMPSIQADLGLSQSGLAWVVNAYLIAFGGLLLLAGRLGDLLGRPRVFMAGLTVFLAASLLGGFAHNEQLLIAARFIQGIGGALSSAVILGMIVTLFPEPRERAKAIGVYAFVGSAGASIGLVLGGVLTDLLSWNWIFFVNLPIGLLTAVFALRVLRREEGVGLGRGADVPGALLIVAALMLGVYTIVETEKHGWGSAHTLGLGAISLALLVGFVLRESRAATPLVPLRIFRVPNVSAANAVQALMIAGMFGQQFIIALFLQRVLDFSPTEVGLAMLPMAVAIGVFSLNFTARLMARFGAKAILLAGLALIVGGLVVLSRVQADASYASDLMPAMIVMGIGAGLALPAITTLAMSGATETDSGVVSGLANTTQQVGAALGLAVLATFSGTRTETLVREGESAAVALTSGYQLAFGIAAGLAAAGLVLAALLVRSAAGDVVAENAPAGESDAVADAARSGEVVIADDAARSGEVVIADDAARSGEAVAADDAARSAEGRVGEARQIVHA